MKSKFHKCEVPFIFSGTEKISINVEFAVSAKIPIPLPDTGNMPVLLLLYKDR